MKAGKLNIKFENNVAAIYVGSSLTVQETRELWAGKERESFPFLRPPLARKIIRFLLKPHKIRTL